MMSIQKNKFIPAKSTDMSWGANRYTGTKMRD